MPRIRIAACPSGPRESKLTSPKIPDVSHLPLLLHMAFNIRSPGPSSASDTRPVAPLKLMTFDAPPSRPPPDGTTAFGSLALGDATFLPTAPILPYGAVPALDHDAAGRHREALRAAVIGPVGATVLK